MKPDDWMILRDDSYAGGVRKYHHDYELAVGPGGRWVSPVTVFSIGSTLQGAMAAYWSRSGFDSMPTLVDKLDASLFDALSKAVLLKRDFLQGSWTFATFQNFLTNLPPNNLLHLVSFWPNGFDEYYPDYLPPSSTLGTLAELQSLVAYARAMGHLVMPYTNPTWWDDQLPTLAALGTGIAARDPGGSPIYEYYGSHGGYVVSPYDSDVVNRQDQTRDEFTTTVPCDFLFEDQLGARGPMYDEHPDAPDPMHYNQGIINVAARSAMWLPTMTGGGFDRLAWTETGFCNSHTINWHWWPSGTYTTFPMAPLWAHENLYFSVHNLAGTTMTNDLSALTYQVSIGYSLSYDLSSLDPSWLRVIDCFQKHFVSPLFGQAMLSFEELATTGRTSTTFADGTIVRANLTESAMAVGDHVVVPGGFVAENDGDVLAAVVSTLYGETLAGGAAHYLVLHHKDCSVEVHQPLGDDGTIAIPRPASWDESDRIGVFAITSEGQRIAQAVTIQPDSLAINYSSTVNGHTIDYFNISYCVDGDADCDGVVDLSDYSVFAGCMSGPGVSCAPGCEAMDLDEDSDVDLLDFARLEERFTE